MGGSICPKELLGQGLSEVPPIRVLHLDHQHAVPLEAVVVCDYVWVVQSGQHSDLIQSHLPLSSRQVEHVYFLGEHN